MFVAILLSSCRGNTASMDSDVKRCADLACKAQRVAIENIENVKSGEGSPFSESTRLTKEAAALLGEMKKKYSKAEFKRFSDALTKAMTNCK